MENFVFFTAIMTSAMLLHTLHASRTINDKRFVARSGSVGGQGSLDSADRAIL